VNQTIHVTGEKLYSSLSVTSANVSVSNVIKAIAKNW